MHFKQVLRFLSSFVFGLSIVMAVCAVFAVFCGEMRASVSFAITIIVTCAFELLILLLTKDVKDPVLSAKDGYLLTTLAWITATAVGALPFFLSKTVPSYSKAFFETMSGFTTTGATVISNVEGCYKSILLWRSITNWLGGMGIIVLFVAVLPKAAKGAGSFNLIGAETVGPVKGKLTPKTQNTALVLWLLYLAMTVLEIILLLCGGLSLFDSVTTAFSTVSTAGFCVKNNSIAGFNSTYVTIIVTVFMFLSAINYTNYFYLVTGKVKNIKKDSELKAFVITVLAICLFGSVLLSIKKVYGSFGESLKHMAFQVCSIISTTGFTSTDYLAWPSFALMLLILTMFIGGCSGSTAGGPKVTRVLTVFKSSFITLKKKSHPSSVSPLTSDGITVSNDTASSILSFCSLYIITWLVGTAVISLSGIGITDCLSCSILTLGNIGAGFTAQTFTALPAWTDWVFSFLMLCGRLELFTVYVLFSKSFYR